MSLVKGARIKNIVIPEELQAEIYEKFLELHPTLQARHQRDIAKVMAKIKAFALINFLHRKHTVSGELTVNRDDVISGFAQYETYRESNELGLPPELYNAFKDMEEEFLDPGLTIDEYQKIYFENYKVLLGRDKARANLKAYTTVGLLYEIPDPLDKRKIRYMCEQVGIKKEKSEGEERKEVEESEVIPPPLHTYSFDTKEAST